MKQNLSILLKNQPNVELAVKEGEARDKLTLEVLTSHNFQSENAYTLGIRNAMWDTCMWVKYSLFDSDVT